jgi:hypothetical protein
MGKDYHSCNAMRLTSRLGDFVCICQVACAGLPCRVFDSMRQTSGSGEGCRVLIASVLRPSIRGQYAVRRDPLSLGGLKPPNAGTIQRPRGRLVISATKNATFRVT